MIRKIICINAACMILLAVLLCIYPPLRAALSIRDPALRHPGVPKTAWRLYGSLTRRYPAWARERVAEDKPATSNNDITRKEWTVFGSVFYLWAIDNLQDAWEAGDHTPGAAPNVFAREAIVAASEWVIEPRHASLVQDQWGPKYLHWGDVLHRMLIIAALTSREQLLHDGVHTNILLDQVQSLSQELDASKSGLLDDYPGECYPDDVMAAIACVRRADSLLHTDHTAFVTRAMRGFIGNRAVHLGEIQVPMPRSRGQPRAEARLDASLPPYKSNAETGQPISEPRGSANAYDCLASPELWPAEARQWFLAYESYYWQERFGAVGFREFRRDRPGRQWMQDSDAGLVVAGYSLTGSTFGLGATRRNGRFDLAYPLATELLATAWGLPGGMLAMPRLFSSMTDAPLLGESALLWQLTVQPEKGFPVKTGGAVPPLVYIVIIGALLFGTWRILEAVWTMREAVREPEPELRRRGLQVVLWLLCMAGAAATSWTSFWWLGLCLLLAAQLFPRWKKPPVDDWDEKARAAQSPQVIPPPRKE